MLKRAGGIYIVIVVSCFALNASAQSLSSGMQEVKNMILTKGYIDNEIITHICSSGYGEVVQSHHDYNALNGVPVVIKFETTSYSISKRELAGKFFGRSGYWGEEIFVTALVNNASVDKRIKKGSSIIASGSMFLNGNNFYGNLISSCFIEFDALKVEIDGF